MEAKIQIKRITLFHDEITSSQIESMSQTLKNTDIINKNQISRSFSISYQNHVRSFAYYLKRNKFIQFTIAMFGNDY